MRRQFTSAQTFLVLMLSALSVVTPSGCAPTQPFYLHEDGDLSHYIDRATRAEHPDVNQEPLEEVKQAHAPFTISNPEPKEMWDLKLQEAVSIAMANSQVIRGGAAGRLQNGQLIAGTQEGSLVFNPRGFSTTYNSAVQETNPGIFVNGVTTDGGVSNSRQGVEAALSEFDAQFRMISSGPGQSFLSHTDRPQNFPTNGLGFTVPVIQTTDGGLTFELSKKMATGGVVTFRETDAYSRGFTRAAQFQPLVHFWTATVETEVRHPLLRGRGVQINRIPTMISRIGNDIEIMNMHFQLQGMLNNIEIRYWDLFFTYRNLETTKVARDSALVTWRVAYSKKESGKGTTQEESQARGQYFAARAAMEAALRNLYDTENELRLLMGIAATDGRLIRPMDEPSMAYVSFDWCEILAEAVARRPELIAKRWEIKQRELELIFARNQLLPQLDIGGVYRFVGLGESLINSERNGIAFPNPGSSAFQTLTGGQFTEWGVFLSGNFSVGFRKELAGVRHAQLRLARDQAVLQEMELDVSTGLAKAIRNLNTNYHLMQTQARYWQAEVTEAESIQATVEGGIDTIDKALDAQRRRAQAQSNFWNAVAEYNKSISDVHARKGSIMEYDGITFAEGPWPDKAYFDAQGLARQRDAGHYVDYGWTRPAVISRGPVPQSSAQTTSEVIREGVHSDQVQDGGIIENGAEPIPAPAPNRPSVKKPAPAVEDESPLPSGPQFEPQPEAQPKPKAPGKLEAKTHPLSTIAPRQTLGDRRGTSGNPLRNEAGRSVRPANYQPAAE